MTWYESLTRVTAQVISVDDLTTAVPYRFWLLIVRCSPPVWWNLPSHNRQETDCVLMGLVTDTAVSLMHSQTRTQLQYFCSDVLWALLSLNNPISCAVHEQYTAVGVHSKKISTDPFLFWLFFAKLLSIHHLFLCSSS